MRTMDKYGVSVGMSPAQCWRQVAPTQLSSYGEVCVCTIVRRVHWVCAANHAGEWQAAATVRPADFVANAHHAQIQSGSSALEPRQRDVFY